ncbi:MAG: LysR family transcriptional regulator [Lawsonibacter sp.]|nr:LysR family transcriptional regulator [Lawsonibacter sp.]MCI9567531.1 LysR family transcriptional regulator [Lawsonibacter sp.]
MDIMSLYYFSELAKDLHMTRTADRLFISQQTLSNHIQRLEEYYGAKLLHRRPSLSLTTAGEFVLAFAHVVDKEQINLKDILSDIERQDRGVLRFGASAMRMGICLPAVLPKFSQRYPNVEIRLTDTITKHLEPMVMNGTLDFALTLNGEENPKMISHHLMDDQVYLCVSDTLLQSCYGGEAEALKEQALQGACVEHFARLPFCLFTNRMGYQIQQCFDAAGVLPKVYLTSTYTQIGTTACFQRLAACFASQMSLVSQQDEIPPDINIFPLYYKGQPLTQRLSLIRMKDRYLSHYSKYFLEILLQYFSDIEHIHLTRKV